VFRRLFVPAGSSPAMLRAMVRRYASRAVRRLSGYLVCSNSAEQPNFQTKTFVDLVQVPRVTRVACTKAESDSRFWEILTGRDAVEG
jgi:hypothetical protein